MPSHQMHQIMLDTAGNVEIVESLSYQILNSTVIFFLFVSYQDILHKTLHYR